MDVGLIAPCHVYCGNHVLYKRIKCLGCVEEGERAEARGKTFCDIYSCAKNKKLAACSDCSTCPCENTTKEFLLKVSLSGLKKN